jgi:isopentenyldiphosphate isomerase
MKIPIVNEQDEVIGMEERSVIHQTGLKHREIHVWLVTPQKEFIFQKRGADKDTWPGFLDVTTGGHIDEPDESYEKAAERELLEETGVSVKPVFIMKMYSESYDPNTDTHNNAFRSTYAGIFTDNLSDLKIEEGAQGFQNFH